LHHGNLLLMTGINGRRKCNKPPAPKGEYKHGFDIKILRFTIAITICGIATKGLLYLLSHTNNIAEKAGNIVGTLLIYYLAYLVVRKYFIGQQWCTY